MQKRIIQLREEADAAVADLSEAARSAARLRVELRQSSQELTSEIERNKKLVAITKEAVSRSQNGVPTVRSEDLSILTPREIEVLALIGAGKRAKQIAATLGVTTKTVVTHKAHIMDKLGIHEGPSLLRFAIRNGLSSA